MRSRLPRGLVLVLIGVGCAAPAAPTAPAAPARGCVSDAWAFYGSVRDASNQPIAEAQVFLLLDKVSAGDYTTMGVRGQSCRTNAFGKYQAGLVCRDNADRPNPCARKVKQLSVRVSAQGHSMKMRVFKLADLRVEPAEGACLVYVPEIKLERAP